MLESIVGVRFSLSERDALFALAELKRMSLSSLVRQALLAELELHGMLPTESAPLLADPEGELRAER